MHPSSRPRLFPVPPRTTATIGLLLAASLLPLTTACDATGTTRAVTVEAPAPPARTFENAIVISVDGLRSDALIALPPKDLPNFARLRQGASTLNARTDPDWTITLPNHTAMITGRFVEGPDGHAWTRNDEADPGETLATKKKAYVPGIFDVAHDRGFRTELYTGKVKFSIYDVTWNAENGAPDVTGTDEGRDKLDAFVFELDTKTMVDALLASMASETKQRRLLFVHFAVTDLTAHASGWDVTPGSRYMKAVQIVDAQLGRILDAIEGSPTWKGRTAIVLTADHGGGAPFKSHDQKHMWVDYVIPFVVWTGGGEPCDLYARNLATRRDPGLWQVTREGQVRHADAHDDTAHGDVLHAPTPRLDSVLPPIRNGDAGNLALQLLGLPPVPGSTIGARDDLDVGGDDARPR